MSGDLLSKWLTHYDPVHRGWTPAGIANAVCATNGFFFPRIRGGYHLRRRTGAAPGAADPIVGSAGCDATAIRTFPWVTHAPATEYTYRLSPISGGGVENLPDDVTASGVPPRCRQCCTTVFDPAGNWLGAHPNAPADLRITPLAGGRFRVQWTYTREREQAEPGEFRVYHDAGTGMVDFATIIARVPYRRGRFHYEYFSAGFPHGRRIHWAVRAAGALTGVEDPNQQQATAWAEAAPPPVNPVVLISRTDTDG